MPIYKFNPSHFKWPATAALLAVLITIGVADVASNEKLLRLCAVRGIDIYYGEYWRFITGAFMHADFMHIAVNCFSLVQLGRLCEQSFGWRATMQVYFIALVGGNALALVFHDPSHPVVGASGAIFGLFGMVLGFIIARTGSIAETWKTPLGRNLLIFLAINVALSFSMPRISFWGHLGGFVPGLAMGYFVERRQSRRASWPEYASMAVLGVAIVGLAVYSCIPFNRSAYIATQALKAYEREDMAAGDALLKRARNMPNAPEGATALIDHLRAWRVLHRQKTDILIPGLLQWPLMGRDHAWPTGFPAGLPFHFFVLSPELIDEEAKQQAKLESGNAGA
ncbi:MAG: rhomboid family intramembrane serine protease [Planctomycetes bacterium]|nr:rhomboid family intramembrane serine protease [Planctomycetota bacterium]